MPLATDAQALLLRFDLMTPLSSYKEYSAAASFQRVSQVDEGSAAEASEVKAGEGHFGPFSVLAGMEERLPVPEPPPSPDGQWEVQGGRRKNQKKKLMKAHRANKPVGAALYRAVYGAEVSLVGLKLTSACSISVSGKMIPTHYLGH